MNANFFRPFLICLLFGSFTTSAHAQSAEFLKLESTIEGEIKKNHWDEIILLAPDLLLEEPDRGEGYYYLAFAFRELNQAAMSEEYLQKAESMADAVLKQKIENFKKARNSADKQSEAIVRARQFENEKKYADAAAAWKLIWEKEPDNLEFALNAVEFYLQLKLFPEALIVLNAPEISKDPEAKKLIQRLNQTKQMKALNGYNESMRLGVLLMEKRSYTEAIKQFDEALQFQENDQKAQELKSIALDEIAWDRAFEIFTIESFEAYIHGNTIRVHQEEAHRNVIRKLKFFGEKYAAENDLVNMELYCNKYFKNYPNDADVTRIKQVMCNRYQVNGDRDALQKNLYAQQQALISYKKAMGICKNEGQLAEQIHRTERLIIRYSRPDRMYYAYTYDRIDKIGLSLGTINNQLIGVYGTVRSNSEFFSLSSPNGTVDNSGEVTGGQFASWGNNWEFKNEVSNANCEFLMGITKKLSFPIWAYAGLGISYNSLYWRMAIYDNLGDYYDTFWVKNSDETFVKPVFESGLILDLNGFNLRGGFKFVHGKSHLSLGIGFSLERSN